MSKSDNEKLFLIHQQQQRQLQSEMLSLKSFSCEEIFAEAAKRLKERFSSDFKKTLTFAEFRWVFHAGVFQYIEGFEKYRPYYHTKKTKA